MATAEQILAHLVTNASENGSLPRVFAWIADAADGLSGGNLERVLDAARGLLPLYDKTLRAVEFTEGEGNLVNNFPLRPGQPQPQPFCLKEFAERLLRNMRARRAGDAWSIPITFEEHETARPVFLTVADEFASAAERARLVAADLLSAMVSVWDTIASAKEAHAELTPRERRMEEAASL